MAEESYQSRTEQPTPKRRRTARRQGRIARSRDLSAALVLLSALWLLTFWAPWAAGQSQELLRSWLGSLKPGLVTPGAMPVLLLQAGGALAMLLFPVMVGLALASLAANYLQGGWLFAAQRLAPDFSRLRVLAGLKRLFSGQFLVELGKSLAKVAVIGGIAYAALESAFPALPGLVQQEPGQLALFLRATGQSVAWRLILALLVLGIADYLYQRYRFEKNLRMTKEEVKEEMRQTEGDPRVKARMKSLMRQAIQKRMMAAVPRADVVVTNPTHVAVALKYDAASMVAPQVVAKGQGFVALKIMALARESGVTLVQNVDLARSLFKVAEVGDYIPTILYRAVAEVLAYVYSLRAAGGSGR